MKLFFAGVVCWFALNTPATATDEPPNILMIVADDLGFGDLRCYGNPHVDTPAIDSLAMAGVRLTDHYAPSPLCAPSRAGILTGRFNHRTGAVDVPSNRGLDRIAFSEKTFGDYFRHAGYATALIGKWHNGLYCADYLPHQRGFDLFYGFPNGGQDYWKWNLQRGDKTESHDGRYLSDALNDEAIDFIRQSKHSNRKFALFLAHHAPHMPFQAPDDLIKKYRQRLGNDASENAATIYAMIEAMDTGLMRVFQTLKQEGLWEKTIIVFTSDNGAQLSKTTMRFHAGLSGNKGDVGEQGIRVPAIVVWPGHIPSQRVSSEPIYGCDWLPTLFAQTGKPKPDGAKPLDGLNVMPTMLGQTQEELALRKLPFQKSRYVPVQHSDAAIRNGRWKLVWPGIPETMKKDSTRDNPSYLRGIVHPHWEMPLDLQLSELDGVDSPKPKLFDLKTDPSERNDIADAHPDLVDALSSNYDAWFVDVMAEWRQARQSIVEHDRIYWRGRKRPDPAKLFHDFWIWQKAPTGTNPKTVDPLEVFAGFWTAATD